MGSPVRESESLVGEKQNQHPGSKVPTDTRKEPLAGSEIEPETLCLQAHKAPCVRCGTFCRTVRRVYGTGEVKYFRYGAAGKPSVNSAVVSFIRPETG